MAEEFVNLPQFLNSEFGLSLPEAKRILSYGVEIDGERWDGSNDIPLSEIENKEVRVGDDVKKLVFVYKRVRDPYFG